MRLQIHIASYIRRVFSALLVLLYVFGTTDVQVFHSLIHDHETSVVHSVQAEADPCHRSLYHHEDENGCKHESHLLLSDSCDFSDVVVSADEDIVFTLEKSEGLLNGKPKSVYSTLHVCRVLFSGGSRAPPILA